MNQYAELDLQEKIASTFYAWTFGAHNGGLDWERTKQRARDGGTFAEVIVSRCYGAARDVVALRD